MRRNHGSKTIIWSASFLGKNTDSEKIQRVKELAVLNIIEISGRRRRECSEDMERIGIGFDWVSERASELANAGSLSHGCVGTNLRRG